VEVVVARIGRPHGVRGEVSVEVRTDDPEGRLAPGRALLTEPRSAGPLTVETARVHSGRLLLTLRGVGDRTAAEQLRGVLLVADVDPAERPPDPEEFYDHQLVGLTALTVSGDLIGQVSDVLHLPGQDVLSITTEGCGEVLVPFVAAIVPTVDLDGSRLLVDPPPGLLGEPDSSEADVGDDAGG
jgi:16S rRNA processing protein RimM